MAISGLFSIAVIATMGRFTGLYPAQFRLFKNELITNGKVRE
jgi:hypothetical protein